MCIFCCDDNFVMQMMFPVDMLNTKVVDNFLILLILKFHYFRPTRWEVIDFTILLSTFACAPNRSEWLLWLTYLNMESCIGDNIRVLVLFLSFPKYYRTPFLVVSNSSYSCSKWNGRFHPNLDKDAFLVLFNLASCRIILIL